MYNVSQLPSMIEIGYTGEEKFRKVEIDMTDWMTEIPGGTPSIVYIRPGETADDAYIAETTFVNNILTWEITLNDLGAKEGTGLMQVWLEKTQSTTLQKRGKSAIVSTLVREAINDPGDTIPPARTALLNLTAEAETLDADDAATAELEHDGYYGDYNLKIGVPKGTTFTPSVSDAGVISWTNDGGKTNPTSANIKGPQGDPAPEELVQPAVNAYLATAITNPDSPPLDRTLSSSSAATPADITGDLKSAITQLAEITGDSLVSVTDFTDATRVSYTVDSANGSVTVTNLQNNTYDCLQTQATFIPVKCVPGRIYRLHAKAEVVSGSPALVVVIRGVSGNDNGIAAYMDLGTTGEGWIDFVADQYMKRVSLFVSFGTGTNGAVAKFSEIWLKEYNTSGIDTDGRAEMNKLKTEVGNIEDLGSNSVSTTWVRGSIDGEGQETLSTTRARSDYITVKKGEKLLVLHGSYYWLWKKYKTDGTYVGQSSFSADWSQTDGEIVNEDDDYKYRIVIRNTNGSTDIVVADIDVAFSKQCVLVSTVLKNNEYAGSLSNMEIVVPPVVNICGGIEQNFYYQNMIKGFNTKNAYDIRPTVNATGFDGFARLTPGESASQTNKGFKIRFMPYSYNQYLLSDIINYNVVPKSSGTGLTKKILLIGDSLTFNQPLSKHLVDDLLSDDVMDVTLIGTLGTAPYLREGRSGWSAYDYVSGYEHGDSFTNAFWNPSTSKFDFSYYMSNNGFTGVDYVFINLGTNMDGSTSAENAEYLDEMVTSIHAYDADIRVGVWTPPPRALMGNGNLVDNDTNLEKVQAIISKFSGRTAERIYIVPVTLNVDPYHDFPYETVNVSSRNSSFQMVVATDRTHPADAGYWKMADVIYNYIKYFGSLDAS